MTKNQIDYWNYVEGKRHNQATEVELERSHRATEEISSKYNDSVIELRGQELGETSRHNVAVETETKRSNLAKEKETAEHNDEMENIGYMQAAAAQTSAGAALISAQAAQMNAETNRYSTKQSIRETQRHNAAVERNTQYANVTQRTHYDRTDAESARHNVATENATDRSLDIQKYDADTRRFQYEENERHNLEVERETRNYHERSLDVERAGTATKAAGSILGAAAKLVPY
nr:hypothetical protein [Picobirnavirus sp.]